MAFMIRSFKFFLGMKCFGNQIQQVEKEKQKT